MGRMFIVIVVLAVVFLVARDAVDLFRARERGLEHSPAPEPQFRHFNPGTDSPAMDYVRLGLAYVVDLLPFVTLLLVVHTVIVPLDSIGRGELEAGPDGLNSIFDAMIALIAVLTTFTVSKALHTLIAGRTQRSLGWYITGYRVADLDGNAPAMWDYVKRSLDHTPMIQSQHSSRRRSSSSRIRYIARDCMLVRG